MRKIAYLLIAVFFSLTTSLAHAEEPDQLIKETSDRVLTVLAQNKALFEKEP